MSHFLVGLWCAMKSVFYTKIGDNHLSGWTKKELQSTSQSQTCTLKMLWLQFGGLLPTWSTTAFWILTKLLHLRSMLSKLVRCTKNYNTCSWHWSTERAQFFSMTDNARPHITQPVLQIWRTWAKKFCLIHCLHWLLTNRLLLLQESQQLFAEKDFHNQQDTENALQELI